MEAEDPLSQLADIHLPDAVSFWPPAPGWWLLALLVLLMLLWAIRLLYRRWQSRMRLSRALRELSQAHMRYNEEASQQDSTAAGLTLLYSINSLLKRVALEHYPPAEVAGLSGQAWLRFLDNSGSQQGFSNGPGSILADGEYRREFNADSEQLVQLSRQWIRQQYLQRRRQIADDNTSDAAAGNGQSGEVRA